MAQTLLERIATKAAKANIEQRLDSIKWFRSVMRGISLSQRTLFRNHLVESKTSRGVGRMIAFRYEPKMKETLPHYDTFPLVIPIREVSGGFHGLNLHYLSPQSRTAFLGKLATFVNNDKYDESTRIRVTWGLLKSGVLREYATPTIKHYRRSQIRSQMIVFHPEEWVMAVFLPTAKFVGATKQKVWRSY